MTSPDPTASSREALEPAARALLSEAAYNYCAGGAEDKTTLRAVQESPGPRGSPAAPTCERESWPNIGSIRRV